MASRSKLTIKRYIALYLILANIVLLSFCTISFAYSPLGVARVSLDQSQNYLKVFDAVWKKINEQYYDTHFNGVDWQKAREIYRPRAARAANAQELYDILGEMLSQLKDRHVSIVTVERVQMDKRRVGLSLGIRLRRAGTQVVVTELEANTLVAEKGVKPGWELTEINGVAMATYLEKDQFPAFKLDDKIALKFLDSQDQVQTIEYNCCPQVALTPKQMAQMLNNEVFYLRFDEFAAHTGNWVSQQVAQHLNTKVLIIDLRNNLGGLLNAVQETLAPFFTKSLVIGYEVTRKSQQKPLKVSGNSKAYTGQIFVLTSKNSASGAEIFAAAIQDSQRGKIVGQKTAGAVLASISQSLPDGGKLHFSVENYLTGQNRRLEGEGVHPDYLVQPQYQQLRELKDPEIEQVLAILQVP